MLVMARPSYSQDADNWIQHKVQGGRKVSLVNVFENRKLLSAHPVHLGPSLSLSLLPRRVGWLVGGTHLLNWISMIMDNNGIEFK